jgi:hypothetical protein
VGVGAALIACISLLLFTQVWANAMLCHGSTTMLPGQSLELDCHTSSVADVTLRLSNSTTTSLVGSRNVSFGDLGELNFDSESGASLKRFTYSGSPLILRNGTLIAIRTDEGHYAKARVDLSGLTVRLTWVTYR